MDTTSLAKSVVDETTIVIDNIAPEQLGNTTPCAEWTVRDVLNHITNGAALFAMSADEGSVSDELMPRLLAVTTTKVPGKPRPPRRSPRLPSRAHWKGP